MPMAMALRIRGGSRTRDTCAGRGAGVRKTKLLSCCSIDGSSSLSYVLASGGSTRLAGAGGVLAVVVAVVVVVVVVVVIVVVAVVAAAAAAAPFAVTPWPADVCRSAASVDAVRALLPRRHADLGASLGLSAPASPLVPDTDTSPSATGAGCASDPSPMTAISPAAPFFGASRDQKAQVEPALGAGPGSGSGLAAGSSCSAGGGGASPMAAPLGSRPCAVASGLAGALAEARKPSQDADGAGGSLRGGSAGVSSGAGAGAGAVWAGDELGPLSPPGAMSSWAASVSVGARHHHPSQPDEAACLSGAAACAVPVPSCSRRDALGLDGLPSSAVASATEAVCRSLPSCVPHGPVAAAEPGSGSRPSGTLESDGVGVLCGLAGSAALLGSKRLRSGARRDRTVPPRMFSRATDVDGDALDDADVMGHAPYQLLALRTCC